MLRGMGGTTAPQAARAALAAALCVALAGCDRSAPPPLGSGAGGSPRFAVVAAEDSWGSVAAQLAGSKARVRSVIADPAVDPHSYQPSARDARAVARASVVVLNGVGYDSWMSQLLRASAAPSRVVVDVGRVLQLRAGANPHRWYYPGDVRAVALAIASAYRRLDPADGAYFAARARAFLRRGLARYDALRRAIRACCAGLPVGYSESVFAGLGEDLRLRLLTPYSFAKAISEGGDVTARDKRTVDAQVAHRRIAAWIYNSQNVTPDVRRVNQIAAALHIPVVAITETPAPPGASFQRWQDGQLEALLRALRRARRG